MLISCPPVEPVALVLREYHQRDEICPKAELRLAEFLEERTVASSYHNRGGLLLVLVGSAQL